MLCAAGLLILCAGIKASKNHFTKYALRPPGKVVEESESMTGEQKLLYHLMRVYDPAVRPVKDASKPIVVRLGLTLISIFDMSKGIWRCLKDEKNQVLVSNVWLDQEWTDELLRWDPMDFEGIKSFRIPCHHVWLPDIVLYNNADDYTRGYFPSRAMVHFDGKIFWPPPTQFRSTCKIDVTFFPFDSQFCYLKLGSWTYNGYELEVTNRSKNVDLTNYIVNGEFDLLSVRQMTRLVTYPCCPEPFPDVIYFIHLRRKILYYMLNVVFPCTMMSMLTLLVFCLPPDSGEKIALGVTVVLAFSVFVLTVAEKMPETSEAVPLIGIYLTVVMGMTGVSVICTVLVLNFHHRGPNRPVVPYAVRISILKHLRKLLCMSRPDRLENRDRYVKASPQVRLANRTTIKLKGETLQQQLVHEMGLDSHHDSSDDESQSQRLLLSPPKPNGTVHTPKSERWERTSSRRRGREGGRAPGMGVPLQEEVLKTLQLLITRQELDDEGEEIASEWREVAQVIDRLLFWVFLIVLVGTTLALLVLLPLSLHENEQEFDPAKYGLPN